MPLTTPLTFGRIGARHSWSPWVVGDTKMREAQVGSRWKERGTCTQLPLSPAHLSTHVSIPYSHGWSREGTVFLRLPPFLGQKLGLSLSCPCSLCRCLFCLPPPSGLGAPVVRNSCSDYQAWQGTAAADNPPSPCLASPMCPTQWEQRQEEGTGTILFSPAELGIPCSCSPQPLVVVSQELPPPGTQVS